MGKDKKGKDKRRGEALPFTLRFEPPGRQANGAVGAGARGGNPLRELFPELDRELLDEVLVSAGRDTVTATAMLLEMLAPVADVGPDACQSPSLSFMDPVAGAGQGTNSEKLELIFSLYCANLCKIFTDRAVGGGESGRRRRKRSNYRPAPSRHAAEAFRQLPLQVRGPARLRVVLPPGTFSGKKKAHPLTFYDLFTMALTFEILTLICASCCHQWRQVIASIMQSIRQVKS